MDFGLDEQVSHPDERMTGFRSATDFRVHDIAEMATHRSISERSDPSMQTIPHSSATA